MIITYIDLLTKKVQVLKEVSQILPVLKINKIILINAEDFAVFKIFLYK